MMMNQPLDPGLLWAGAVLGAIGATVAWARNLPRLAWDALLRQVTVSIDVRDQDLVKWVGVTAVERWGLKSRRTAAILRKVQDRRDVALEPARGRHFVKWRGREC